MAASSKPPPLEPAGFPQCRNCPFVNSGNTSVCYRCASATFETVTNPCVVCSRQVDNFWCENPLCNRTDRSIERIAAVAVKTGAIDATIQALKYKNVKGWAMIFGRIVLGYLQEHHTPDDYDLIVANPTFVGPGSSRTIQHTELVIEAAAYEDLFSEWSFDNGAPRAIIKTGPSPQSATGNYQQKLAAADALYDVLAVPDDTSTAGRRILLYDDVCTTGLQLDRVARFLKDAGGAASVEALVLARTPWRR